MNRYTQALEFAATKHIGTSRRNGDAYIIHPIRVSQEVKTEQQKIIALLHDTLEDTGTTLQEIVENFGQEVAMSVEALSHRKDEPYDDYISRVIAAGEDTIRVKIADIADNLSDSPTSKAIKQGAISITRLVEAIR